MWHGSGAGVLSFANTKAADAGGRTGSGYAVAKLSNTVVSPRSLRKSGSGIFVNDSLNRLHPSPLDAQRKIGSADSLVRPAPPAKAARPSEYVSGCNSAEPAPAE